MLFKLLYQVFKDCTNGSYSHFFINVKSFYHWQVRVEIIQKETFLSSVLRSFWWFFIWDFLSCIEKLHNKITSSFLHPVGKENREYMNIALSIQYFPRKTFSSLKNLPDSKIFVFFYKTGGADCPLGDSWHYLQISPFIFRQEVTDWGWLIIG